MDTPDPATYGEAIAGVYDDWYGHLDTQGAVDFLAEFAAGGRALELGVGTGRVALPLSQRGVEVTGIDISQSMLDALRANPGGESIHVVVGDFVDPKVDGTFRLVYVVFNTIWSLLTQDDQVRCFQSVARLLEPGGVFVVEALVPNLSYFAGNQRVVAEHIGETDARLGMAIWDSVHQRISKRMVTISSLGTAMYPVEIRYIWPSEMDLMGRLAGLDLLKRFGGWHRAPLTPLSPTHVSVYTARA